MKDPRVDEMNELFDAIETLCRFCPSMAAERCLSCGANLAVKANWDKLSSEQKERCDCPWNGMIV